jgi:hypothetical protein
MNRIVLPLFLALLANDIAMAQGPAPALSTEVARTSSWLTQADCRSTPSTAPPGLSGLRV